MLGTPAPVPLASPAPVAQKTWWNVLVGPAPVTTAGVSTPTGRILVCASQVILEGTVTRSMYRVSHLRAIMMEGVHRWIS